MATTLPVLATAGVTLPKPVTNPPLAKLGPAFMTVTYGAGGTTSDPTLTAVLDIQGRTGVPTASHLTYVSTPIYQVATYAESLKAAGIGFAVHQTTRGKQNSRLQTRLGNRLVENPRPVEIRFPTGCRIVERLTGLGITGQVKHPFRSHVG